MSLPNHYCSWLTPLLVFLSSVLISFTQARDVENYRINVDSFESPLYYIGKFDLGRDGDFEISLRFALTILKPHSDDGRVMLHLLACSKEAADTLLNLPSPMGVGDSNYVAPYCAMTNRTLEYYCQSFPLEDMSPNDTLVYQVSASVSGVLNETLLRPEFSSIAVDKSSTILHFFIDACETVGGQKGILRSCLGLPAQLGGISGSDSAAAETTPCFYCLKQDSSLSSVDYRDCVVPAEMPPVLKGIVLVYLCIARGKCLHEAASFSVVFYAISTAVWSLSTIGWAVHVYRAPPDATTVVQSKMAIIPLLQALYSALSFVLHLSKSPLTHKAPTCILIATSLAQLSTLAYSAGVLLLLSKGWQITQSPVPHMVAPWICMAGVLWASSFVVLRQWETEIAWVGFAWVGSSAAIIAMAWYFTTTNVRMLHRQSRMTARLGLEPTITAAGTKIDLFGSLQAVMGRFLTGYIILSIVGFSENGQQPIWSWIAMEAHDTLSFLLFVDLGHNFRCRTFSVSPQTVTPNTPDSSPPNVRRRSNQRSTLTAMVLHPDGVQSLGITGGSQVNPMQQIKVTSKRES